MLEQAKDNAAESSAIDSLVIDRGFLYGKVLYEIDQQGIGFVIPLKGNMEAAKDARQLALCGDSIPVAREVTHGYEGPDQRLSEMAGGTITTGSPGQTNHLADVLTKTEGP